MFQLNQTHFINFLSVEKTKTFNKTLGNCISMHLSRHFLFLTLTLQFTLIPRYESHKLG